MRIKETFHETLASLWLNDKKCRESENLSRLTVTAYPEKMARRVLSVVMVAAAIAALLSQSLSFLAAPKEGPRSVVVPAAAIAPALPGTKNDNQRLGCCKHAM